VLLSLLSGLIDGDGSVHANRNTVHYGTISTQLANDIQIILQQLGILSRRYLQKKSEEFRMINDSILTPIIPFTPSSQWRFRQGPGQDAGPGER
jgi:intein/homing endonuclease